MKTKTKVKAGALTTNHSQLRPGVPRSGEFKKIAARPY
jgi:hypothetical protein